MVGQTLREAGDFQLVELLVDLVRLDFLANGVQFQKGQIRQIRAIDILIQVADPLDNRPSLKTLTLPVILSRFLLSDRIGDYLLVVDCLLVDLHTENIVEGRQGLIDLLQLIHLGRQHQDLSYVSMVLVLSR